MMSPEQRERLPKYAQRELQRLEANLRFAKAQLASVEDDDTEVRYGGYGNERPLPKGSRVMFDVGEHRLFVEVNEYHSGPGLEVYASERLSVTPQSSNVIVVEGRNR